MQDARARRLANLFKEDWTTMEKTDGDDDEEPLYRHLDHGAATSGIDELIDKVEVHLQVEMGILRKWKEKDFAEIKKEAPSHFPQLTKKESEKEKQVPF